MAASLPHRTGSYEKPEDCQTEVQDLRAQVQTRPVIKQAKGSLIAKHGCTSERAFQMLAEASERENRKFRDIAKAMVEGAQAG